MFFIAHIMTLKHVLHMVSMLLAGRSAMMNEKPQLNTRVGNSELIVPVNGSLDGAIEMIVAVPVKDTPDLVKAWIAVLGLISHLPLSQLNDLVRCSSFSAKPNQHGWITDKPP
jgi:hypothetical protein